MTYQTKQLANLAGVSVRTLRYYDQIGLLKPAWVGANGYRYYENAQVNRLQQICLYRAMQLPLAEIQKLLAQTTDQQVVGLQQQYQSLLQQREHLDQLLTLVQTTIRTHREETTMNNNNDEAKFKAFKAAQLAQNEAQYGEELQERYDEPIIEQSQTKYANLSATDYQRMQAIEAELVTDLTALLQQPTLDDGLARQVYQLHRQWLSFTWPHYTATMHRGLADMYVGDDRFTKYYDQRAGIGATAVLVESIKKYAQD
ncbi:MerR family transcriptional regulator [Lactiplantibacillus paraxiangfangensis]|uniref:MerR family transcriptional regulator n=1 Tax=Lactiplantibacillus paraxiangfangensis TaxID=3076224 RepID=UPI0030C69A2C